MTMYDLPATSNWSKLLREHGLLNTFCKMLVPGMAQNDLLLEIVMIVSTVASDLQVGEGALSGRQCSTLLVLAVDLLGCHDLKIDLRLTSQQ